MTSEEGIFSHVRFASGRFDMQQHHRKSTAVIFLAGNNTGSPREPVVFCPG